MIISNRLWPYRDSAYLNDFCGNMTQHNELGVDESDHQLRHDRIKQDQIHHPADHLDALLVDACQLGKIIDDSQPDEIS